MRSHPVYGTNVDGGDETDGNVYASPARPTRLWRNKKTAVVAVVQVRDQVCLLSFSVDIVKFMRPVAYTHMREMCLSRVFCRCIFRPLDNLLFFLATGDVFLYCVRVFAVYNYCRDVWMLGGSDDNNNYYDSHRIAPASLHHVYFISLY